LRIRFAIGGMLILGGLIADTGCHSRSPRFPLSHLKPRSADLELLLDKFSTLARARAFSDHPQESALLFTPTCRASCRGMIPMVIAADPQRFVGRWLPRLGGATLLWDLALLFSSYDVMTLQFQPQQTRFYYRFAFMRANLVVEGKDRLGRSLTDRGLIDLTFRQDLAGWKIASLAPARLERLVYPLPDEMRDPRRSSEAAAATAATSTEPVEPADSAIAPSEGHFSDPGSSGESLPQSLLSLEVKRGLTLRTIQTLAGAQGTVVLFRKTSCPQCVALHQRLDQSLTARPQIHLLEVLLDRGPASAKAPQAWLATGQTRQVLQPLTALLPTVALITSQGQTLRWFSTLPSFAQLETNLEQLSQQPRQ
jgi:hypothetical protein